MADGRSRIVSSGLGVGGAFALMLSWLKWQSFWWAILHAIFGWAYVAYYFLWANYDQVSK